MARPPFRDILRRNLLTVAITLVAVVVLVGSVLLGSGDSESTDSVVQQSQSLNANPRADATKKLDKCDKSRKHGDKADRRRELKGRPGPQLGGPFGGALRGPMPKELREDLQYMRKADPSDRAALQHKMFAKALAGDYGDRAKKRAEKLEELVNGK